MHVFETVSLFANDDLSIAFEIYYELLQVIGKLFAEFVKDTSSVMGVLSIMEVNSSMIV